MSQVGNRRVVGLESIAEKLVAETGVDQILLNIQNYSDTNIVARMAEDLKGLKGALSKQTQRRMTDYLALGETATRLVQTPLITEELESLIQLDAQYIIANFKFQFEKRYGTLLEGFKELGPEHVMGKAPGIAKSGNSPFGEDKDAKGAVPFSALGPQF